MQTKAKNIRFTPEQRKKILERDGYKCVFCGMGERDGATLHVFRIKPKDLGGKATVENGQTLCSRHVSLKNIFKQPEIGRRMFLRMYRETKTESNAEFLDFCNQVIGVYARNNIGKEIVWKR